MTLLPASSRACKSLNLVGGVPVRSNMLAIYGLAWSWARSTASLTCRNSPCTIIANTTHSHLGPCTLILVKCSCHGLSLNISQPLCHILVLVLKGRSLLRGVGRRR